MVKAVLIEDISSRDYRINITQGMGIVIQHTVIRGDYLAINGKDALPTYKLLKRLLKGGKTALFNKQCASLILASQAPEVQEIVPEVPNNALTIKLYAGDVLIRTIKDEHLWMNALYTTIEAA